MRSLKKSLLFVALLVSGCAHVPQIPMPEQCSALPNKMICPGADYFFGAKGMDFDAGGFVCFRPAEIAPFLEKCGKR